MARRLIVEIVGDADKLERELRKSQRSVDTFGKRMGRTLRAGGIAAGAALGAGLVVGLKKSVDAAMEAQAVLGQTQVALKNVGASWGRYGGQIQTTTTALSRLAAVNDEDLLQSFQVLLRGTKDVNKALELNAAAADLARGRNMDLTAAATLLVKVHAGQLGAARRLGIQIGKNATSQQALDLITRRYAGAAEAYGRSAAGAQDRFRVAIGELEEKIGEKLLPTVTEYLDKGTLWLENTENTDKVVGTLETSLGALAGAIKFTADMVGVLDAAWDKLPDFGKDKGLLEMMDDRFPAQKITDPSKLPAWAREQWARAARARDPLGRSYDTVEGSRSRVGVPAAAGTVGGGTAGQSARELRALAERATKQANTWFDNRIARMLGRAGDPAQLQAQIGRLRTISGLLNQRLAVTKDITRRLKLEDQRADIAVQIRDRQQQLDDAAAAKNRAAAERKKADAATRLETRLGWIEFGIERADATKTLADNRRWLRRKEAFWKEQIASEDRNLNNAKELWRVRQQIRDLNKSQADKDPLAGLMQISSRQLAATLGSGLGLGTAGMRRLRANVAGAEIRPVYVNVQLDGQTVGRVVTTHQTRNSARTARQTSGFRG